MNRALCLSSHQQESAVRLQLLKGLWNAVFFRGMFGPKASEPRHPSRPWVMPGEVEDSLIVEISVLKIGMRKLNGFWIALFEAGDTYLLFLRFTRHRNPLFGARESRRLRASWSFDSEMNSHATKLTMFFDGEHWSKVTAAPSCCKRENAMFS